MTANKDSPEVSRRIAAIKDSPEVAEFMRLFQKLKDWSDDDPQALLELATTDELIKDLCSALNGAVQRLQLDRRKNLELFTAPVDSKFITAWRDFEERFEPVLYFPMIERESDWKLADFNAEHSAGLIEATIELANSRSDGDKSELGFEFYKIEDGVWWAAEEWAYLNGEIGFDLRGVFRRRRLVPFVLFPRHVAARRGQNEKLSIYKILRQAQEAFVFGTPFAALALMRAIMEVVLRENYGADGNNLSEQISNSKKLLPKGADEAELHRLRKFANAILHLDPGIEVALPRLETIDLELEILSLLRVLRALIEGAPQWPPVRTRYASHK
jgi:hypothetical protein